MIAPPSDRRDRSSDWCNACIAHRRFLGRYTHLTLLNFPHRALDFTLHQQPAGSEEPVPITIREIIVGKFENNPGSDSGQQEQERQHLLLREEGPRDEREEVNDYDKEEHNARITFRRKCNDTERDPKSTDNT